ncbi:MAG TPA: hypothetical protein VH025_03565, partial [Solirubrobacteraceae bacterium]|nr:hypothetical protein [Solirubrobacteraceae bacterium]
MSTLFSGAEEDGESPGTAASQALPNDAATLAAGIPGSELAGPFPVGEYAAALREKLRSFA